MQLSINTRYKSHFKIVAKVDMTSSAKWILMGTKSCNTHFSNCTKPIN